MTLSHIISTFMSCLSCVDMNWRRFKRARIDSANTSDFNGLPIWRTAVEIAPKQPSDRAQTAFAKQVIPLVSQRSTGKSVTCRARPVYNPSPCPETRDMPCSPGPPGRSPEDSVGRLVKRLPHWMRAVGKCTEIPTFSLDLGPLKFQVFGANQETTEKGHPADNQPIMPTASMTFSGASVALRTALKLTVSGWWAANCKSPAVVGPKRLLAWILW